MLANNTVRWIYSYSDIIPDTLPSDIHVYTRTQQFSLQSDLQFKARTETIFMIAVLCMRAQMLCNINVLLCNTLEYSIYYMHTVLVMC